MKAFGVWQLILWVLLLLFPFLALFAQQPLTEAQDTKFQTHFFEALKQKGIGNFDKALISLETCQKINPTSKAVLFELSKNNLALNQYEEAIYFVKQALQNDSNNLFLLTHLVKIYKKQQYFSKAIEVYKKIYALQPNKIEPLVQLYLLNGQAKKAIAMLNDLEAKNMLSSELIERKNKLQAQLLPPKTTKKETEISVALFERNKNFEVLQTLISNAKKAGNYQDMLSISEMGLQYFPAQPKIYLSKAQALNKLLKFEDAIETLEIGLDFVIDNKALQQQFYKALVVAYKATNNPKDAKKYQKMLLQ